MRSNRTGRCARSLLAGLTAAALASAAIAQQPQPADADAARRAQEALDKVPNTPGDGPYPALIETDPAFPRHVIYRPADLTPFEGGKLPVLVWGNGACVDDGTAHRLHLAEIASYGYLVIAAGGWRSGPGATEPRASRPAPPAPPRAGPEPGAQGGGLPSAATSAADVGAGIDWAIAENERAGSTLRGKIATGSIAAAGHSCGGLQAIEVAADPRVKTLLVHNSGIFNDGANPIPGIKASKDMLGKLHAPVIYILGGESDIAWPNGTDDFARLAAVPAVLASLPVGHGGTFSEPMGGAVAHVAVDWLEWQLKGDTVAARTFVGDNCRLCTGTRWSIERKGLQGNAAAR